VKSSDDKVRFHARTENWKNQTIGSGSVQFGPRILGCRFSSQFYDLKFWELGLNWFKPNFLYIFFSNFSVKNWVRYQLIIHYDPTLTFWELDIEFWINKNFNTLCWFSALSSNHPIHHLLSLFNYYHLFLADSCPRQWHRGTTIRDNAEGHDGDCAGPDDAICIVWALGVFSF